jgi:MYXO-CTERM domain-containing protein
MPDIVPWVEEASGVDITPCHDVDGTWNPTPQCEGFALDPLQSGSWDEGCAGPLEGPSESCGPPYTELDEDPPLVDIVEPGADKTVEPGTFEVVVEASDEGFGLARVELYDNDVLLEPTYVDALDEGPFVWTLEVEEAGPHLLRAVATDAIGLMAEDEVELEVELAASEVGEVGEPGCECRSSPSTPHAWAWLLLLAGLRRRRR